MTATHAALHPFEVLRNESVAKDIYHLRCQTPAAACLKAGQFVNLEVPGDGSHLLRIPLSFAHASEDGVLDIYYAVVGEGTRRLTHMRAHDTSTLVAPLGNGWSAPREPGRALLVAGGIGLPPVVAAAEMLSRSDVGFDVVVGAQTSARHVGPLLDELRGMPQNGGCDCARKVLIATDDGSCGVAGFANGPAAELLGERAYACVYACGPGPMLASVAALAREAGVGCQVSMERMMGCGFGACSCCNVALAGGGFALCCSDGPVFDAREVAW